MCSCRPRAGGAWRADGDGARAGRPSVSLVAAPGVATTARTKFSSLFLFIFEASMLLSEHVAFYPRMANVDWRKGWAESFKVLAVG